MLLLANGCYCSELSVHPKNWNKKKALISNNWYIHYRFYDPAPDKPKLVILKSMNKYHDVEKRREVTKKILENEIDKLRKGYNPFLKKIEINVSNSAVISPGTPFINALWIVYWSTVTGNWLCC